MEQAIGPWTGDPLAGAAPAGVPVPQAWRTRRWSLRIGRDGIVFSSATEGHGALPLPDRWRSGTLAGVAVAGGLALLLVGASTGRAWSPPAVLPDQAMAVPAATPLAAPLRPARPRAAVGRPLAPPVTTAAAATDAEAGPAALTRAQAVETALRTGEFQEWADRDGTTGYAVAGPAEAEGAATCRALAVLVRQADGRDAVTSDTVCRTAEPGRP